jgi:hypothetical protein
VPEKQRHKTGLVGISVIVKQLTLGSAL